MKIPCCSVCQTRYNEEERVPLLLQCGHGFCRECLYTMFSASLDTTLPCPKCRHVSTVGNSVQALRKNYAVLALIHAVSTSSKSNFDCDFTDDDEDEDEDNDDDGGDGDGDSVIRRRNRRDSRGSVTSSSGGCGPVIELGVHPGLKFLRRIGEGRRAGMDTWTAVISGGGGGGCRHHVAVKKVEITEGMNLDMVKGKLEKLRRASMWCRNVCTFHGAIVVDKSLCLVMDRCYGSVKSEMQRNEGRLTLEQVLRFFWR